MMRISVRGPIRPRNIHSTISQRETSVIWNPENGKAIHRAVVWQDRRTASVCEELQSRGLQDRVREITGLVLDPYFSGTKLAWMLDRVSGYLSKEMQSAKKIRGALTYPAFMLGMVIHVLLLIVPFLSSYVILVATPPTCGLHVTL